MMGSARIVVLVALFFCVKARSTASNGCSDVCDFYEWGRDAMCQERNLVHIPQECKDAKTLRMQDNRLRTLPKATFGNFTCLKYLYLERNNMAIDEGAFLGCDDLQKIDLSENNLPKLTQTIMDGLSKVMYMFIDSASVQKVENLAFKNLTRLNFLSLKNNRLQAPPCNAFPQGNSLQTLYLSNNKISHLPNDCFSVLTTLTKLYLNNNPLLDPNPQAFSGLGNLLHLDLISTNLRRVPTQIFQHANKIKRLYLSFNDIHHLSNRDFASLVGLEMLYLQHNHIITVDEQSFEFLSGLQVLDLSNNSLNSIGDGALEHCTQLLDLKLQYNHLNSTKNLSLEIFSPNTMINLSYNPLHCDCSIYPFLYFLHTATETSNGNQATCYSPQRLSGRTVSDLNYSDVCSEKHPSMKGPVISSTPIITWVDDERMPNNEDFIYVVAVICAAFASITCCIVFLYIRKRRRASGNDYEREMTTKPLQTQGNDEKHCNGTLYPALPPRVVRSSTSSMAPLLKEKGNRISSGVDTLTEEAEYMAIVEPAEWPASAQHQDPNLHFQPAVDFNHHNHNADVTGINEVNRC